MAAESVTILKTEPGSYSALAARSMRDSGIAVLGGIRVERRPVGDGQQFARVRILDDDGAGLRLRILNRLREFLLRDVLNFFVEGENDAGAGVRAPCRWNRTSGGGRRPGSASCPACCGCGRRASIRCRPGPFRRCPRSRARARQVPAWDKSARLPAGNKFRADSWRRCARLFPEEALRAIHANECEAARRVAISSGGTSRTLPISRATMSGSAISDGTAKRGIHRHAHGQRVQVAVKNFGAACADFDNQPLLVLRAGVIFAVAEKLQVGQASQCRPGPDRRQGSHNQ